MLSSIKISWNYLYLVLKTFKIFIKAPQLRKKKLQWRELKTYFTSSSLKNELVLNPVRLTLTSKDVLCYLEICLQDVFPFSKKDNLIKKNLTYFFEICQFSVSVDVWKTVRYTKVVFMEFNVFKRLISGHLS